MAAVSPEGWVLDRVRTLLNMAHHTPHQAPHRGWPHATDMPHVDREQKTSLWSVPGHQMELAVVT